MDVTNDWNLINRSNNIIVGIICIILGDISSSQMETKHCTQTFIYDTWDSKLIKKYNEFNFTLDMKSNHPTKAKVNAVRWKCFTNNNVL
jgi:hypothetical protein